jgi:hypothetical protein
MLASKISERSDFATIIPVQVLSPKRLQRVEDKGNGIVAQVRTNWDAENGMGQFFPRREITPFSAAVGVSSGQVICYPARFNADFNQTLRTSQRWLPIELVHRRLL